jgi:type II secretory pathway pseudopilin PulG
MQKQCEEQFEETHLEKPASTVRSRTGQLGTFMLIALVLIGFLMAAYAVDFSHMSAVQAELHNATDAAALAGAQDLWFDIDHAEQHARQIAARNRVDGNPLSTDTPGTTMEIIVTPPQENAPGTVRCSASVRVIHLFAPLWGHPVDSISATSLAGTKGKMWILGAGQAFPVAVSLDAIPQFKGGEGVALNTCSPGDTFTLYLGSQSVKNATFTSLTRSPASGHYIGQAIDQSLGISPEVPGFIPAVKVGDDINLNNGIDGQKKLADTPYIEALRGKIITLPVIMGSSPFNQSRAVVGFVGLKVTGVTTNKNNEESGKEKERIVESITGVLCLPQMVGVSGPIPTTGFPIDDKALERLQLGPIQLIE